MIRKHCPCLLYILEIGVYRVGEINIGSVSKDIHHNVIDITVDHVHEYVVLYSLFFQSLFRFDFISFHLVSVDEYARIHHAFLIV